jgi:hypothetical protein
LTWIFLSHLYKSFFRSPSVGKDTAVQIALAFIVVAFLSYSLALGFALEKMIIITLEQNDAIAFLNRLLIYYFIGGFITRYLVQSLPVLDAQPYLHLPVPRSKIANFLLGKSLIHVTNISVFLLFTPFAFGAIARAYGLGHAWVWLLSLWFFSLINHFLVILVKRNLNESAWRLVTFIAICALFASADYFGWLKLSLVSEKLFNTALQGYMVVVMLFLVIVFLYYVAYRTFINRLYPEEFSVKENQTFHSVNWSFLQNFGLVGAWIRVELKLIFRNKRSRELFLMHIIFLLLAFAFYSYIKNQSAYGGFVFVGMICSGFFTMNYGQFLFNWQGDHFDFTLTQPTSIRQFIESKYWLLASMTALWFLFSIPFVFLGWQYLLVNLVASLYNIGVNIFVVMNMSMWGAKRMDLKHPGSINLEGMGAAQWIMGIPLIASPYLFYLPFSLMGHPVLGLVSVGLSGLIGIVFRRKIIDFTSQRLYNMRHTMSSNFRKG